MAKITYQNIIKSLNNIKGKHKTEGRSLLILLYYTGIRPEELLNLKAEDITKVKSYIAIKVKQRTLYIQNNNQIQKELYNYSKSIPESMILFPHYLSPDPKDTSANLRYYIKKWTGHKYNMTDLRNNRIQDLANKGTQPQTLKTFKGKGLITKYYNKTQDLTKLAKHIK